MWLPWRRSLPSSEVASQAMKHAWEKGTQAEGARTNRGTSDNPPISQGRRPSEQTMIPWIRRIYWGVGQKPLQRGCTRLSAPLVLWPPPGPGLAQEGPRITLVLQPLPAYLSILASPGRDPRGSGRRVALVGPRRGGK